jgi:hypothetical protein
MFQIMGQLIRKRLATKEREKNKGHLVVRTTPSDKVRIDSRGIV